MDEHPKTVFCDIDGVIFKHRSPIDLTTYDPVVLPGVSEAFCRWTDKGHTIVLVTGRPFSLRALTETQLANAGLFFRHLIMDLPRGQRVVINDAKTDAVSEQPARSFSVRRDSGLKNVDI